ncbi:hypothetical protein JOB18_046129 [Solea senegalensis]|uniref:Uncharacterized protein n=1 Tax=Solea senegalensis TaxID=28829 RepID=A0AAV6R088_SOLSE|nr:hypothetical protein JOB18_046129 [Solea senegalensis]
MADGERKRLVWAIKKTLLTFSADELFQIARSVGTVPGIDESRVKSADGEDCFEELKIQGGQIGDQGSDLSYNSVCRQMEDGLKEQFSNAEVGEQSDTELFQELMYTKQKDNETPQQLLYRVIGLKQKIMLASKHADTDVKYSASTVQDVFLHTVYQGLSHKHDDVRREMKPLLVDTRVLDEAILKQMKKIMGYESERQRRLGPATRQRLTNVHSAQSEVNVYSVLV